MYQLTPQIMMFLEAKNSRFPETCSWMAISPFLIFTFRSQLVPTFQASS